MSRLVACSLVLGVSSARGGGGLSPHWDVLAPWCTPCSLMLGAVFEVKKGTRVFTHSPNAIHYRRQSRLLPRELPTLHQGGSITRIEKKFGAYFRACSCCDCDGVLLSRFGEGSSTAEHYSAISFCLRQFEPLELHLNLLLLLLKLLLLHFDHL